jgi:Formate hydrogenlyase subunit 6/NADH:ubiquinone oxidoreductase 23 kD subunit (chain I)
MIFYFTGTGNSLHGANRIAEAQGDRAISIAELMDQKDRVFHYDFSENAVLGFVYPVYAWGPPKMVLDFIKRLEVTGNPYVFSLCTCGGSEGNTSKILRKALRAKELQLDAAFTLKMPDNYVVGFDVDSKETEKETLKTADLMLTEINKTIAQRKKDVDLTIPGKYPAMKTALINPLFNQFALGTKKFFADDNCISCGLCEQICPVHTIKVTEKPVWGKECTQCLGCINRCPVHAIQYGKATAKRGRYYHHDLDAVKITK